MNYYYLSSNLRLWGTWALLSLFTVSAWAQGTIRGTITDQEGTPVVGASILIKGTTSGVLSDGTGTFSLTRVPVGEQTLVISYYGYETQEQQISVQAEQTSQITVGLVNSVNTLDEVVVTGYGTQRKREALGAISQVKVVDDNLGNSFEANLQGKAVGVQVIQSSGLAGAGSIVRIRGAGSLSAGGDPLYVVDGIPITQDPFLNSDRGGQNNNPLSFLNPADIESVDVLKDAAAAAIYGSRGANGVVLITTKRGAGNRAQVKFSARAGVSEPANMIDMLNADEWIQLRQEAWENDGNVGRAPLPAGLSYEDIEGVDTDWIDLMIRQGFKQDYNLSVTKGGEKFQYYLGASYLANESYLVGNRYDRGTVRANLDLTPVKWATISISSSLARGLNNRVNEAWAGGLGKAQSEALPIYPVFIEDGSYFFQAGQDQNPVAKNELIDWQTSEWRSINTLKIQLQPAKGLAITATGSVDYMDLQDNIFEDEMWTNNLDIVKLWETDVLNWQTNGTVSYDFSLPEDHNLAVLAGGEFERSVTQRREMEAQDLSDFFYRNPTAGELADTTKDLMLTPAEWNIMSFFSRVNYTFKGRYLLQAIIRVDGSSKFGANNKFGNFPSLGLGYIMSDEPWFKVNAINFLKLKAGWGLAGNADIDWNEQFGVFSNNAFYNNTQLLFPSADDPPNPNLGWELNRTWDFGIELGMFQDRLMINATYYDKLSTDVIVNTRTQASSGFRTFYQNIGEISNRGFEIGIQTRQIEGAFRWRTNFNIARNVNEVISIGKTAPDAIAGSGDTRVIPGHPVGVNFLVQIDHVDPATGLPVFLTPSGEETFNWSEDNRVIVGNVVPDAVGGITNIFEYQNFDLNILFTYTIGGNIYDDAAKRQLGVFTNWNMRREILSRWRKPGDEAAYPRLTLSPQTYGNMGSEWQYNTDQWLYDASFLRLKNVTFGYNVNVENVSWLSQMRVFFAGTNLWTLTRYPGWDPEIVRDHNGPQGRNISPNVTYLPPPQERVFSVGLNMGF